MSKIIKSVLFVAVIILSAATVSACGFIPGNKENKPAAAPLSLSERVEAVLAKMSDEEKIGQLIVAGIEGENIDANARRLIQKYHIGGIILFDRNMASPSQTTALVNQLQKESLQQNAGLPLFICIDQEGGQVTRMRDRFAKIPSQEDLAQNASPGQARFWAAKTAAQLKTMGINVNFAPVVDLGAASQRSYGTEPFLVESFARQAVGGYQQEGIFACLKHFPGIGRTKIDPHEDTYTINADRQTLSATDLVPFRNLIRELDNQSFFVMVSHLKYPAFDDKLPASLSKAVMQDLLRGELGFKGIIITDDMEMGALTQKYSFREMGSMAVGAGADLVLVCHDLKNQASVYEGMLQALQSGVLSRETLHDRLRRLIEIKLAKISSIEADPALAEKIVGQ